jgi:cysteine synthase
MKAMAAVEELYEELKPIPLEEIKGVAKSGVNIFLKREYSPKLYEDPLRTIKRKPALLLLNDLIKREDVRPKRVLISASSGNFVRELGLKALKLDLRLIAVTPPRIPEESLKILTTLGLDVIHVSEEYDLCPRETTVFYTRALVENYRFKLVNVDQYNSWQNVLSHLFMTWKEIKEEIDDVDYIPVQLGSTGTFMGISLGKHVSNDNVEIIGVQPPKEHHIPGVHHIVNGCEWSPEIYSPNLGAKVVTIDDIETYAALIRLWEKGFYVGPSTGMGFAYAMRLASYIKEGNIVVLSPDSIFLYYDYILDFLNKHDKQILERYPELEDSLEKYKEWLKRGLSIESRINVIKNVYKPKREGRVYEVSEVDHESLEKIFTD